MENGRGLLSHSEAHVALFPDAASCFLPVFLPSPFSPSCLPLSFLSEIPEILVGFTGRLLQRQAKEKAAAMPGRAANGSMKDGRHAYRAGSVA